jgi:hypothetical protein
MTVANEEEPQASFFEVPSEAQIRHESMLINEVSLIWRKKEPLFQ